MNITKAYLLSKNLNIVSPEQLRYDLSKDLSIQIDQVYVLGDLINRSILLKYSENEFQYFPIQATVIAEAFHESHDDNIISITEKEISFIIQFKNIDLFITRIVKPHIKLISLYHQENFPLPRFPLGISDIAAAIRKNYLGKVSLADMQFGKSTEAIFADIEFERPDIIGISATFGQHDLIELLISLVKQVPDYDPLIIFGGSLSTLNAERLLDMLPNSFVSKGYGETTMQDVVKFWLDLIPIDQINFIAYRNHDKTILTQHRKDDKNIYATPELDLLEETLKFKGVMQLESSRGCTYHCSFCPRSHKGRWSGEAGGEFQQLMPFIKNIFDKYPKINSKIFLVDEEFIGYKFHETGVQNRALQVAMLLKSFNFKFESSTRIDQVYQPSKKNDAWLIERIDFWKGLIENGLDRMLFGVESGVDSILKRFNKQSTSQQNVIALRILTTIGVPLRLSYITFDPLMTLEELILSYEFQGRKDILLKKNNSLTATEIATAVFDSDYISQNASNLSLYSEITYMLVSMESLVGSEYLKKVEEAGLAEESVFLMGKRNAKYKDANIGLVSYYSQLWVDRNFALDYLLKSIIKISGNTVRTTIIILRIRIKDYSFRLLGKMLSIITGDLKHIISANEDELNHVKKLLFNWNNFETKETVFLELIDAHFELLVQEFTQQLSELKSYITEEDYALIEKQVVNWTTQTNWNLINNK
jgi:radical SAM superfamily enzyme YgiQ (UPF0313 family)